MRKKQKQSNNPEKQMHKDLEYLQRKLGEQKENLVRQNKKLQKQIHEQIQENRLMRMQYEKKQQIMQSQIDSLRLQVGKLNSQIIFLQQQANNEGIQQQLKQALNSCKNLSTENQQLQAKLKQFLQTITQLDDDIKNKQKQNNKYIKKLKDQQSQIKNLAEQIGQNHQFYKKLQQQSNSTRRQLKLQIQQNRIVNQNLSNTKKKLKQYKSTIQACEKNLQVLKIKQHEQFQQKINELKKEIQDLQQKIIEKQRTIQFLKITQTQKNNYVQALTKQLSQLKNIGENNLKQITSLASNLQKVQNQNRRMQIQFQKQKSKAGKQLEEIQKKHQEQLTKIKRKTAEQVSAIIMRGGSDVKALQNYMEGLKSHKSQMNLRNTAPGVKFQQQKFNIPFQKYKYENQINNLNHQLQSARRSYESQVQQCQRIKKLLDESKTDIQNLNSKIKQKQLHFSRLENDKNQQNQNIYKQLTKLRNIQTQLLEMKRSYSQLQEATDYKVSYYDKKLRQNNDTLDRKQSIIQNLKIKLSQTDNKSKFMQQKLLKSIQQVQSLRRYKNDSSRKEELVKDYKEKIQKYKAENETLKLQIEKLKKDKTRLERNLQSKQEYINTLKAKYNKQQQQKESQIKQQKNMNQIKQKYEAKLKKYKKQVDQLQEIIQSIRSVIAEKIQQAIKKSSVREQHVGGLPERKSSWEGAALLGLKSNQIQEFVNPTVSIDRNICEDLDELWEKRNYQQFIRSSIQYLILKNQIQPDDQ